MARILLIDDTPEIAELLTFALRDHGYEVIARPLFKRIAVLAAPHDDAKPVEAKSGTPQ